ncbi:MAG: LPS export ABC transporter periplasmic protein LptC [Gammaproteobacteria bacterium]|nr:LPS export ABC transporter periplasmic protein LptC [Gammaproteobacteria bacterium]
MIEQHKRPLLLTLLLALIVLGINHLSQRLGSSTPTPATNQRSNSADYTMQQIERLRTNAAGQLSEQITATTLRHFPANPDSANADDHAERIELEKPEIQLASGDNSSLWQLQADSATLITNEIAELSGHVHAQQLIQQDDQAPISFTSAALVYDFQQRTLTSPGSVTLTQGATAIHAGALQIALDEARHGVIELSRSVYGVIHE